MIDCQATLPAGETGIQELLAEMDRVGIRTSLVRHAAALRHDPERGNALALELASGSAARLVAIGVVAPLAAGPARAVASAARGGVRGFWLGSRLWRGSPVSPSAALDELLDEVARWGLPLLVPLRAWGDATAIGALTAGLGIPVILVGAHYDHIVDDLAAAERHPHLHLETSSLAHFGAVDAVVRRIGHERLLLGTGLPDRPPSAPVAAVLAADLDEAARAAILGGNAARLFGLPAPTQARPAALRAPVAIDVHAHLPPAPWDVGRPTPADLVARLGQAGIERAIASSLEAILVDMAAGNAALVAACAAEQRLLGYLVADPADLAATRAQLARHGDAPGIVGVKVHCQWSGTETRSPRMASLFELLAAHGRPVTIHVDGEGWPEALADLARRHPRLPIIAAHAGPGAPAPETARLSTDHENLHLELASSFAGLPEVRAIAAAARPGSILLGTDAPLLEPAWALGTYADAGFGPASHPEVSRDAALRLFGLGASAP
jgi:hypothetical protein